MDENKKKPTNAPQLRGSTISQSRYASHTFSLPLSYAQLVEVKPQSSRIDQTDYLIR